MDSAPKDDKEAPQVFRDAEGKLLPGSVLNPDGRGGNNPWQSSGKRLAFWYAKPGREIRALLEDENRLADLSSFDIACMRVVVGSMFGKRTLEHFEAAMDRIEGKPVQMIRNLGNTGPTPDEISNMKPERAQQLLDKSLKGL